MDDAELNDMNDAELTDLDDTDRRTEEIKTKYRKILLHLRDTGTNVDSNMITVEGFYMVTGDAKDDLGILM